MPPTSTLHSSVKDRAAAEMVPNTTEEQSVDPHVRHHPGGSPRGELRGFESSTVSQNGALVIRGRRMSTFDLL